MPHILSSFCLLLACTMAQRRTADLSTVPVIHNLLAAEQMAGSMLTRHFAHRLCSLHTFLLIHCISYETMWTDSRVVDGAGMSPLKSVSLLTLCLCLRLMNVSIQSSTEPRHGKSSEETKNSIL